MSVLAEPREQTAKPKSKHIAAIDVVRVMTVALVIVTHTLSFQPGGRGWVSGPALVVSHVSRQVFFLLTAFVLTYSYRDKPAVRWPSFWKRRYLLIGVPYLVWSAIYILTQNGWDPYGFLYGALTGTARYHLYFLVVSMQLYLAFPLLRGLVKATEGKHRWLLAGGVLYQVVYYEVISHWLTFPDPLIVSYLGYVVVGAIAARHTEQFLAWTRAHKRAVLLGSAAVSLATIGWFFVQVTALHREVDVASRVFQPLVALESFTVAWTFLAIGLWWEEKGKPLKNLFRTGADVSFGVYLSHPLLLQAIIWTIVQTGLAQKSADHLSDLAITAITILIEVPFLYLTCAAAAAGLRRTPLSLPLTGHPRRRPAATVAPAVPVTPGGLRCEQQTA